MSTSPAETNYCHFCGKETDLKRCGGCSSAYYCSKEHQEKHWPAHRHVCSARSNLPDLVALIDNTCAQDIVLNDEDLNLIVDDICRSSNIDWLDTLLVEKTVSDESLPPVQSTTSDDRLSGMPSPRLVSQRMSQIVNDMNNFGICVLDNFLGAIEGRAILNEVMAMYEKGCFSQGQVVCQAPTVGKVRGDFISWVQGNEPHALNIGFLVRALDAIISRCTRSECGEMGRYNIGRRTKAMVACYPGEATNYVKHIDNPNKDGRRITCIYYLNENWNSKVDGGLLRIYPENHQSHVANVEPLFDRLVMFWSDTRNPHEVLPAYRIRFAITVWYFDVDELAEERRRQAAAVTLKLETSRQVPPKLARVTVPLTRASRESSYPPTRVSPVSLDHRSQLLNNRSSLLDQRSIPEDLRSLSLDHRSPQSMGMTERSTQPLQSIRSDFGLGSSLRSRIETSEHFSPPEMQSRTGNSDPIMFDDFLNF